MTATSAAPRPLAEVTHQAFEVLSRELGAADAARFIGQFTSGSGDYTAERTALFTGLSLEDITAAIRSVRSNPSPPQS